MTTGMRRAEDRNDEVRWGRWIILGIMLLIPHVTHAALDADDCGACHPSIAAQDAATGGHAIVLDCGSCHADRRDGSGAPHFTDTCTRCHDHAVHFDPVATDDNCVLCHADETARHARASGHMPLPCGTCHAEVSPTPGTHHRAIEACESCHDDRATHAPAGHAPFPCVQCHDAHGSENIDLVREVLTTPAGSTVPIRFDSIEG